MSRSIGLYLEDIGDAARLIVRFRSEITVDDWDDDSVRSGAINFNFIVIGEAIKRLPETVINTHPQVDWKVYAELSDFLAHQYFHIEQEQVLAVVQNELPLLVTTVHGILAKYSPEDQPSS